MPAKEYYLEQIEKELATAREAQRSGNDGKVRVCARRAAGQAITWYLSRYPHPAWGPDALTQLKQLKDDPSFSQASRDAAMRLTSKVSEHFTYQFSTHPLDDADIIIHEVKRLMEPDAA
jgi:hypothetical protein